MEENNHDIEEMRKIIEKKKEKNSAQTYEKHGPGGKYRPTPPAIKI
ncbi:MAG: hypothetical protein ABFD18_09675 [Syntrophomonas sp.]